MVGEPAELDNRESEKIVQVFCDFGFLVLEKIEAGTFLGGPSRDRPLLYSVLLLNGVRFAIFALETGYICALEKTSGLNDVKVFCERIKNWRPSRSGGRLPLRGTKMVPVCELTSHICRDCESMVRNDAIFGQQACLFQTESNCYVEVFRNADEIRCYVIGTEDYDLARHIIALLAT